MDTKKWHCSWLIDLAQLHAITNMKNKYGDTPLHAAAGGGHEEVTLALMPYSSLEVKNYLGRSLLHSACAGGNVALVRTLIKEYKLDPGARDNESNTPLHVAALRGHEEVTLALIPYSCPEVKGHLCRSLLHSACAGGNVALVKTLIKTYKFDPAARDSESNTPLHVAVINGRSKVMLTLIEEFGCNPNMKGNLGRSILHFASTYLE